MQADECYAQCLKLCQRNYQVFERSGEAIQFPHEDHFQLPLVRVSHETIERRPRVRTSANAGIGVLADDLPAPA
jgi:hypothetical protein